MRLWVAGSRGWKNWSAVENVLDFFLGDDLVIVHGGAQGADALAHFWAKRNQVPEEVYLPCYDDTTAPRKRAPLIRNEFIAQTLPDRLVAFWDGQSTGTLNAIAEAKKHGIPSETWR